MPTSLGAIVEALGGVLSGSTETQVTRLASLSNAQKGDLSFIAQARYAAQLSTTHASALVVPPSLQELAAARGACIVTDDPYLYFARLTQWWAALHSAPAQPEVHPTAQIHPDAELASGVDIGPFAVVEAGASLASGCRVGAHTVVGRRAVIGANTLLYPRVVVGERCTIGERCIVHAGVVIGADGFGFAPSNRTWVKIEQLGAVRIGNDVEIGANTCIDRGALEDTVIEDGVKLDNLIQIGHNVRVGAHTAMAGCVGVAGSADIGAHCTVGGGAIVLGHLKLADGVNVSAASVVTRSIARPGLYTGMFPIDDNAAWEKNAASLKQLNRLRERLKAVEQAIAQATEPRKTP
ncbi:MAG: UDP-3-O-(3-hydroxymyristoyl)glucosamine N-acyltransferase [Hydrogenophaga sp.]